MELTNLETAVNNSAFLLTVSSCNTLHDHVVELR